MKRMKLIALPATSVIVLSVGHLCLVTAQEGSKDIGVVKSEEVVNRSAQAAGGGSTTNRASVSVARRNVTYRPSRRFTRVPPAPTMEFAQVGLTVWRLQEAEGAKEMDQEGKEAKLEQLEASKQLSLGSMVRLGIEPLTHDGFLYVIDREQFADLSYGAARLIFPTLSTRNGNNRVRAHELVLIPRPPSYFRINPSSTGKTQTAEVLTIIVSPTPLQLPAALGERAMTISDRLFKSWETQWGTTSVNVLEMNGGAGLTTSVKAQVEGAKSMDQEGQERQQLTQDDPLPQTIYRATVRRGRALLVTVPLQFKAGQ